MAELNTLTDMELIDELNRRGVHPCIIITARDVMRACEEPDITMTEEAARYGVRWVWNHYDIDLYRDDMIDYAVAVAQDFLKGEK